MKVRRLYLHSFEIAIFRLLELLLASCVNLSKCNWKIKKRRCVEFTIYLNVPKNKLEVHVYSTWPPFHTSSFFVSYPRQLFFFPSFLYFDLNFMGWFFHIPFNACGRYLLTLRQTLDEDYVLEKLFEIVLTLQQRFLLRNTFQQ